MKSESKVLGHVRTAASVPQASTDPTQHRRLVLRSDVDVR